MRPAVFALCFVCSAFVPLSVGQSADRFDGPAELPRVLIKRSLADTPAPGRVQLVADTGDLQQAFNAARCGDTLKLTPGAVHRGLLRIPAKPCDDDHWIVVRSSTPDEKLPAEGTRLTPCYAGIASLPGRPDFHCNSVSNVLPRIEFAGNSGSGPIIFDPGANHYRFIGIEITRADTAASITALVEAKDGAGANHIIFDRVWMHGTAQAETRRGIALSGMTYVAVVDSFFTDFHCVSGTGACGDSQTMSAGGGDSPEGPFKIVNNFLEAAGENIIFGGRPAKTTPTDIEIRHNHFFKPLIWKQGQAGFFGGSSGRPFIVKNHFELKNAQRVLFEDNLLENNWGGFSQAGFSILLSPKNQQNGCPTCQVTDVTIRRIKIVNVGSVFQIANTLSDAGGASAGGGRYSIHDVLVDGVQGQNYQGSGLFALVISNAPPLRDVRIEHVTALVPRFVFSIMSGGQKIANFTLTNNLLGSGMNSEIGSAGGGPSNCAFRPERLGASGVFTNCFDQSTFTHNLIVGGGNWPKGNIVSRDAAGAGIPSGTSRAWYNLCRQKADGCKQASPALGASTDGKDIGADAKAIDEIMQEVR